MYEIGHAKRPDREDPDYVPWMEAIETLAGATIQLDSIDLYNFGVKWRSGGNRMDREDLTYLARNKPMTHWKLKLQVGMRLALLQNNEVQFGQFLELSRQFQSVYSTQGICLTPAYLAEEAGLESEED